MDDKFVPIRVGLDELAEMLARLRQLSEGFEKDGLLAEWTTAVTTEHARLRSLEAAATRQQIDKVFEGATIYYETGRSGLPN